MSTSVSSHETVSVSNLMCRPIALRKSLPNMISYRHPGELNNEAVTPFMCLPFTNSGSWMSSSQTDLEESNEPFAVVVNCLCKACFGIVPYGKAAVLIIVPVLPESQRAMRGLPRGIPCIDLTFISSAGVRSFVVLVC